MTASAPQDQPRQGWSAPQPQRAGPAAGVEYAGFWVRVVAWILDAIVLGVITAALVPIAGGGSIVVTGPNQFEVNYGSSAWSTLLGLLYFVGFWTLRGQTPGMIPFRMRVAKVADGSRPDWVVSLLRYVGLIISFVVILIGVIWVAFDSRKQGWHDKIAGTVVVRDVT